MRVLHVASEVAPFAQSGGLADVVAGLPAAQAESYGLDAAVLVPLYRGVAERLATAGVALDGGVDLALEVGPHALPAAIRIARVGRVHYGFLDCPLLYDRPGGLYGPHAAGEFGDNHVRFAALGKAALAASEPLLGGAPDVLHVHDWQGSAAAIYARIARAPSLIVTTIHNLAYRGIFPKAVMAELGIPWSMFTSDQVEFYDQVSFLKAGLAYADVAT
ncbi:MAG TPA: glycogen/starch synthase, partial [Kofleriaceae bacterium]|nr:glycogen/starch synthase [Kofleriaceae bacterium]